MNSTHTHTPFPNKKYDVIYADPPWQYKDKTPPQGGAEAHYRTMPIHDIMKLPVSDICNDDCVLFLWATYPLLPDAFKLIEAWGFIYKTIGFQWVKKNKKADTFFFGLGRWTRGNTECCLIATRGKPKRESASVSQLVVERITRHSAKPPVVRDKISELMGCDKSKIELFAREYTDGWDVWGNEV